MRINLAVLPWANLDSEFSLGKVSFVPWSLQKKKMSNKTLSELVESYVSIFKRHGINKGKLQVVDPVVVLIDGDIDIQPDQQELLDRTVNLLFFLATAWDEMAYINNNAFEIFFHPISTDRSIYVFGPNRALTIASDYRDLIITEPLNTSSISRVFGIVRNESYVKALERLQQSKKYGRIADASLNFYRLAYDDHYPNDYLKLGFLISAFETLFGGKGNRERVTKAVGSGVLSNKRMVVYDKTTKHKIGLSRPAGVIFAAYERRNDYLHNGRMKGLGIRVDGEYVPLWNLTGYAYQQYFLKCLEDWKILKWNQYERMVLFDRKFDQQVSHVVERTSKHRSYINKRNGASATRAD